MYLTAKKAAITSMRKKKGFSQSKLSELAGLGHAAVYRMEEMDHKVHPLRAKAVAEVLGCKVEDLFEDVEREVS